MGLFSGTIDRLRTAVFLVAACASCFGAVECWGQAPAPKTILALPPAPLLPATLGKLERVEQGDSGDGLGALSTPDFDGSARAALLEDGIKRYAASNYVGGNAKDAFTLSVKVYKFVDASGASSAYDFFRRSGMKTEKLGDSSATDGDELLILSGLNVVREKLGAPAGDKAGLAIMTGAGSELIGHLPKATGTAALAPLLPAMLPSRGLNSDSIRYSLGPAGYRAMGGTLPPESVGFDKSAEVVTARYRNGGVLTLLLYPTPQIAGDHGRAVEALLKEKPAGTVNVRREGPLVIVTTGAWGAAEAQKIVDGIHLRNEVTFDKKMPLEFHAEVAKTYSLLSSVALLCGVGAVAAVVMGLFFGGGRALIRVLQGKPAASEPEFLRIDLRGPGGKGLAEPPKG